MSGLADVPAELPLFRQLAAQLEEQILAEEIAAGDLVPSSNVLAERNGVNPATVIHAFRDLEGQGILRRRRGVGMVVTDDARERIRSSRTTRLLRETLPRLRAEISLLGVDPALIMGDQEKRGMAAWNRMRTTQQEENR